MTKVEVTCRLDDRSRVESQSHVDRRYDVVTAMTESMDQAVLIYLCINWSSLTTGSTGSSDTLSKGRGPSMTIATAWNAMPSKVGEGYRQRPTCNWSIFEPRVEEPQRADSAINPRWGETSIHRNTVNIRTVRTWAYRVGFPELLTAQTFAYLCELLHTSASTVVEFRCSLKPSQAT